MQLLSGFVFVVSVMTLAAPCSVAQTPNASEQP